MNIWKNFSQILTLEKAYEKDGRNLLPKDLSLIKNATIVFNQEKILWVGKDQNLPEEYSKIPQTQVQSFEGLTLTPEIVDSHTHLVFSGDRSGEYSMRLNGASYEEIANTGGGILSTSKATNAMDSQKLFEESITKIERIYSYGIGTIEIKSGYGLNYKKEYELSHIIHKLKKHFFPRIQIKNTFMAAHAIPKEFPSSEKYLNEVVIPLLKKLAQENIIDFVDIFHEKGYFSDDDTEALFQESKRLSLPFKSHADEFADNKGALLAARMGATSTDHLLCTESDGIKALANSKTVATLLPGTGFFLGKPQAQARQFLDQGVKIAIASDYNPGSCHCDNLLFLASLAAPHYQMNQTELWSAITLNGAHALNLKNQGALIPEMSPRFSLFRAKTLDQITYNWGHNLAVNISQYLPKS